MSKGLKLTLYLLAGLFFIVLVISTPMMQWIENHMIFYPIKQWEAQPQSYQLQFEDIYFKTEDGIKLSSWFFPGNSEKPVILLLHGNAGNISHRLEKIRPFVGRGYSVFIIDYRGFGKSEGTPHEKGTYLDAKAAYNYLMKNKLVPANKIIVYGESLGTAVAIDLAAKNIIGGLILEAPFTRIVDMAKVHFPFVPSRFLKTQYDNLKKIPLVHTPILIIHGSDDEIVPFRLGQKLFEAAKEPKTFVEIPGGTHNEAFLLEGKKFWNAIFDFLENKNST